MAATTPSGSGGSGGGGPSRRYMLASTVLVDFVDDFEAEPHFVSNLALSKSGKVLAAASTKRVVHLFDTTNDLASISEMTGHSKMITGLVSSAKQDEIFVTSSYDGFVCLWDTRTSKSVIQIQHKAQLSSVTIEGGSSSTYLAAASADTVFISDVRMPEFKTLQQLKPHSDEISHIKFHPVQRNMLWSSSFDGLICSHDMNELSKRHDSLVAILPIEEPVKSFGFFGKDAGFLSCETSNHNASLWRISDEECLVNWKSLREDLASRCPIPIDQLIQFCSVENQLMLLCGSQDGEITVWRVSVKPDTKPTLEPFTALRNVHTSLIREAVWPTSTKIFTGGEDARICEWRFTSAAPPAVERKMIPSAPVYSSSLSTAGYPSDASPLPPIQRKAKEPSS